MNRKKTTEQDSAGDPITWQRVKAIFNNPLPPTEIWERQFDYMDDDLRRLAATLQEEIPWSDLRCYYLDLTYVELQPDLFAYLFPACLMDWHQTLMKDESCSHGDSDFHLALQRGGILEKMLTPKQREDVYRFFRDSFLIRLDAERAGRTTLEYGYAGPEGWPHRFNSLGLVMPRIDLLWDPWWGCGTPGRAFAVLFYCAALMYPEDKSPLFWNCRNFLLEHDAEIYDSGWLKPNVDFLQSRLTIEYVREKLECAVARLTGEPEEFVARRVLADWQTSRDTVTSRIQELPIRLARADSDWLN